MTLLGVIVKFAEEYVKNLIEYYGKKEQDRESSKAEGLWKRKLVEALSKLEFDCSKANKLLNEVIRGEISLGRDVIAVYATLSHEGVIGVGSGILHGVFEIGLSWDYILDLPVIPGSAVKGATRSLTLGLCATLGDSEARCKCLKLVFQLFGWIERPTGTSEIRELEELGFDRECMKGAWGQGLVIFHDAYPVADKGHDKCVLLEPWVITPHYGSDVEDEYDVTPNPLPHVVIKKGSKFEFIVSYDANAKKVLEELMKLIGKQLGVVVKDHSVFLSHLVAATLRQGVGARTSKGYTSFDVKTVVRYRGG